MLMSMLMQTLKVFLAWLLLDNLHRCMQQGFASLIACGLQQLQQPCLGACAGKHQEGILGRRIHSRHIKGMADPPSLFPDPTPAVPKGPLPATVKPLMRACSLRDRMPVLQAFLGGTGTGVGAGHFIFPPLALSVAITCVSCTMEACTQGTFCSCEQPSPLPFPLPDPMFPFPLLFPVLDPLTCASAPQDDKEAPPHLILPTRHVRSDSDKDPVSNLDSGWGPTQRSCRHTPTR